MSKFLARLLTLVLVIGQLVWISSPSQATASTFQVSGTVVDSAELPLTGGYRVSLYGDGQLYSSQSASDGSYSVQVPAGNYSVDVIFEDSSAFPGFTYERTQLLVAGDISGKNLSVAMWPTGSSQITGVVTDSAGTVNARVSISSSFVHFSRQTGSDGAYSFENLPGGTYSISFSAPNHYPQTFTTYLDHGSASVVDSVLQINSSNSLAGHVLTTSSTTLGSYANVWISACNTSGWCTSSSITSQGEYFLSNLPAGRINVSVYGGQNARIYSQTLSLTISQGENLKEIFVEQYPTGPRSVTGRVLSSGNPIAGAQVNLYSANGKQYYSTTTDSSGTFLFSNLTSGKYSLNSYRDGYRSVTGSYKSIQLLDDQDADVTLSLALRASGVLRGNVTTSTESAEPVAGSINVCLVSTWECSYANIDALGNFVLSNVPSGNLQVRIYPNDRSNYQIRTTTFNMSQALLTQNFTVEPVPAGTATISGTFVSADSGEPVPHSTVSISLYGPSNPDSPIQSTFTTTDDAGNYRFERLVHGRASLTFSPPQGIGQQTYLEVQLDSGEQKTLNPYFQGSSSTLTLDVCATSCVDPENKISNMQLSASAFGPKYEGGPDELIWNSYQNITSPEGQLNLTGLPKVSAGKLRLIFDSSSNASTGGFLFAEVNSSQSGTPSEGFGYSQAINQGANSGSIAFPALRRTGSQSVTVQFKNLAGEVVPNEQFAVQIYRSVSGLKTKRYYENGSAETDLNGTITLNNLSTADLVSFSSNDLNYQCSLSIKSSLQSRRIICKEMEQDNGPVQETGSGSISGSVVDQNNASVVSGGYDLSVELCITGSSECRNSPVDPEGTFMFGELPNGTYLIRALSGINRYVHGVAQEVVISDSENSITGFSVSLTKLPLGNGNSLSATIMDSNLGKPLYEVGVTARPIEINGVELSQQDDYLSSWVSTDRSGAFRLEDLAPGTYALSFSKNTDTNDYSGLPNREVYAPLDDIIVRIGDGEQVSMPDIVWDSLDTSNANTLLVKLIDKVTREPLMIPDTACWIFGANEPLAGAVDDSGAFSFRNLIVGQKYTISCSSTSSFSLAGQMIEPVRVGQTFIAQAGVNTLVLPSNVIKMRGKISGRVVDENNLPLVGVQVGAAHGWDDCTEDSFGCGGDAYGDYDMTDEDGYFYLENLPEIDDYFFVSDPRYSYLNQKVDMAAIRERVINVTLYPIKNFSGRIVDSNGLPVGASQQIELVSAADSSQWASMQVNADAQGQYLFRGVSFGSYYIRLIRSSTAASNQSAVTGYLTESGAITSRPSEAKIFTISGESGLLTTANDAVISAGSSISGSVRFVDGSGNLVSVRSANLVARLYIKDGSTWQFMRSLDQWLTTKSGVAKYSFKGLVPGSYKVRFSDVPWNGQGLQTIYNGNKSTLAEAPEIVISGTAPNQGVDASLSSERPAAADAPTLQLNFDNFSADQIAATENEITAILTGGNLQVQGPLDQAGQWVAVGYAEEQVVNSQSIRGAIRPATIPQSDWIQLDANGRATISASTVVGSNARKLALVSSKNQLLGWTALAAKPRFTLTPSPSILGVSKLGQVLSVQAGTWDHGVTLNYVWMRAGQTIQGATGSSYRLGLDDIGKSITVNVTGSKAGFDSVSKTSSATLVVLSIPQKPATSRISGTAAKGKKLTLITSGWVAHPGPTFKYQWYRCSSAVKSGLSSLPKAAKCKSISKAVRSTYTLTSSDRRKYITATATASNSQGKTGFVLKSTSRVK